MGVAPWVHEVSLPLWARVEFLDAWKLGYHAAHERLGVSKIEVVLFRHKREGPARLARASRASDAVDVVLGAGDVEVHDVGDLGNVDAS